MRINLNAKTFQNIIFFSTIWVFFSLNSKFLRIPNAEIWRWVLLGLLIVLSFITDGKFALKPPSIIFFFIIAVVPSIILGINQKESFIKFLSFIVVVWGGYIYFSSLNSKEDMELSLKIMLFIMIAFELQSVFYVLIGKGYDGSRMTGNTTNSNTLGVYSNLAFLAAFYWFSKFSGIKKVFFLVLMLVSSYTSVASGSRTAVVTIFLNIVIAWFVIFRKSFIKYLILLPILAFIGVAVFGDLKVFGIEALNRLADKEEGVTRGALWDNGIKIWKQYPVFGCGYELSTYLNKDANGFHYPFHNSYLSILAEVGVWGVVIIGIGFLSNIISSIKRFIKEIKGSIEVSVYIICFMMMIELLIAAWSESFLFAVGSTEACTFWMLFTWNLVYLEKKNSTEVTIGDNIQE